MNRTLLKRAYEPVKHLYTGFTGQSVPFLINEAIGELHEALQHYYKHKEQAWAYEVDSWGYIRVNNPLDVTRKDYELFLHNTVEMELADTVLRLASLAQWASLNLNADIPCKHSAISTIQCRKIERVQTLDELVLILTNTISRIAYFDVERGFHYRWEFLTTAICMIDTWCDTQHIDLDWFINVKIEYNKIREWN